MTGDGKDVPVTADERPPPEPAPMLATTDVPESFDDDLAWIVAKYLEKTGARAGVLSVHYRGDQEDELIFSRGGSDIDADAIQRLIVRGSEAGWRDRRREDSISPNNWGVFDDAGRSRLTLSLPLAADINHRIVLTTLFDIAPDAPRDIAQYAAARLQPVLSGYFKLWLLNRAQRRRLDGLACALDRADVGVFLLDGGGNLMFVNECGEELLEENDGLRRMGGMLAATDVSDTVKLRVAIDHVAATDRSSANAGKASIVPLRRGANKRALIASIMPVDKPPRSIADPAVILHVFSPDVNVAALLAPICQLYALSPAETRLVGLLAEGFSVNESAEKMRVKVPTLRTYLKQIFAKTGTARQSDLIRLMMGSMIRTRARQGHRIL